VNGVNALQLIQKRAKEGSDNDFSIYLDTLLAKYAMNTSITDVLFEILLGEVRLDDDAASGDGNEKKEEQGAWQQHIQALRRRIVEPSLVPVLLQALSKATKPAQLLALKNFVLILENEENASVFLSQENWQQWIFPLVFANSNSSSSKTVASTNTESKSSAAAEGEEEKTKDESSSSSSSSSELYKLSMSLLATVHYEALCRVQNKPKASYNVVHRTFELMHSSFGWNKESVAQLRVMLLSVLSKLRWKGTVP
jgi:hypothetical protein